MRLEGGGALPIHEFVYGEWINALYAFGLKFRFRVALRMLSVVRGELSL